MISSVSVVTVCRNPGPIISEAIRSVQGQAFPRVEHIVIDACSEDGTPELARRLLRPGDTLISEPDRGIYDAMNKGVSRARGDVIAILNADDRYADAGVLSRVVERFNASGTDAVLGDVTYFRPGHAEASVRRFNSGRFKPSRIGWGWMPAHAGMVLTRDAYRRVGPYRTDFSVASDFEFVARAFRQHRLSYSYMRDVFVKMQLGGLSTRLSSRREISRQLLRACRENDIPTNWLMLKTRYFGKALELLST